MTGRAHGIIAIVEAVGRLSNHDVVCGIRASVVPSFIGVVNGPPEVRKLGVVLTAGSRALATTDLVVLSCIEVADYYRQAGEEFVRDGPEEVCVVLNHLDFAALLAQNGHNPHQISVHTWLILRSVELGSDLERLVCVDLVLVSGAILSPLSLLLRL